MKVSGALQKGQPTLAFEFFPPKTAEQEARLFEVIAQLKDFNPDYVSVTYGALGTSAGQSFRWVKDIKDKFGIAPVAHLTCVASSREDINTKVKELVNIGVENILALRGDIPEGLVEKASPADGCRHACELVAFIKELYPFICLGVAGYPEKHPEAPNLESDIKYLKRKVEAGADYIVTQLFFDNGVYFDFVRKCRDAGICVPIIPGIMPITNYKLLRKMTSICGASIPKELLTQLEKNQDDNEAIKKIGIEHAVRQCQELQDAKVPGLHFFVMNQAGPISEILKQLS